MAFNSDLLGPRGQPGGGQPGRGQLGFSSRDSDWAGVSQAGLWSEAQEEAQGSDLPPPPLQPGWELVKIGCRRIADLRGSEDPTEVRPPTPLAASRPRLRYHGSRNWSFSPAYRDLFSVSKSSPHLLSTDRLPAGWAVWDPGHPWWAARPHRARAAPVPPSGPPGRGPGLQRPALPLRPGLGPSWLLFAEHLAPRPFCGDRTTLRARLAAPIFPLWPQRVLPARPSQPGHAGRPHPEGRPRCFPLCPEPRFASRPSVPEGVAQTRVRSRTSLEPGPSSVTHAPGDGGEQRPRLAGPPPHGHSNGRQLPAVPRVWTTRLGWQTSSRGSPDGDSEA